MGSRRDRRHVEKRDGPIFHGGDEQRTKARITPVEMKEDAMK
jgi:hypothetical protein